MVANNTIVHTSVGDTMTQAEFEATNSHTLPTGGVIPVVIRKSADETVNNSDALQNDDTLVLPVEASSVWDIKLFVLYNSGATPDLKLAFTVPASGTIYAYLSGFEAGTVDPMYVNAATTPVVFDGTGSNNAGFIHLIFVNSTNAGNVQLQWAQNTANASDTKVLANSFMLCTKLN